MAWFREKRKHSIAGKKGWINRKKKEGSPLWNQQREKALIRNPDGTFKDWKGGYELEEMKKQKNTTHGISTHIGKEFKRQNQRKANIGDKVRTKKKDGSYHKGADWYIKTENGWRRYGRKRPDKDQVKIFSGMTRKGQPARRSWSK